MDPYMDTKDKYKKEEKKKVLTRGGFEPLESEFSFSFNASYLSQSSHYNGLFQYIYLYYESVYSNL